MAFQLVRKKIYPNVHVLENKFSLSADGASSTYATIYPVITQDEGLGDPNSKYTNPESASFSQTNEANCYPDSRVNYAQVNIELALSKAARETDKVKVMKVLVLPIHTAFIENLTATNEVTSEEVEDILELSHETTDRQTYPTFTGTDLAGDYVDLGTNQAGLTTNTNIEAVAFDVEKLYDALQFYTNAGKIRSSIGSLRWLNVSDNRNIRLKIRARSKNKRMNPYNFFGVLILVARENTKQSTHTGGELTAIDHIHVKINSRYNEWNENFNFMR